MAVYKYSPIDLERPTIRLIRLRKGYFAEEILCDLFDGWIKQSDGGIPYEALSYTWGTTELTASISVNGSKMLVTLNLCMALRHLRSAELDRILWIDAICIDQDNTEERRHQVQQMSSIYKEAEQVIIWLGEGTEETDQIMDAMKRLQHMKRIQEDYVGVEGDWRRSAQLWMCKPGIGGINNDDNAKWRRGMEAMLMRPWFQRIWILQEVANARVATVHCGGKSISARTFAQVPSIIGFKTEAQCQAVLDIMPGLSREESWWRKDRNLHTLLIKFGKSRATDERDIIYALLGISSDACQSAILLPDYSRPLEQVIHNTALFLLGLTNKFESHHCSPEWTLSTFLHSLDSLSGATLENLAVVGQEAIAKLLLTKYKIDVNLRNKGGQTPLMKAAKNGHMAVVQLLLEHGADVESKDYWGGQTPLTYAVQHRNEAVVRLLLENGAKVESKDNGDRTPLYYAIQHRDEAIIRILLQYGADVESTKKGDRTPLIYVVQHRDEAIVRLLLENGAKVESKDNEYQTPLYYAIQHRDEAIVRLLLEYGADVEDEKYGDRTPLIYVVKYRDEAIVRLLLQHGAKIESKDNGGRTPLNYAIKCRDETIVRLLLENGADVESKDNVGRMPLAYAVKHGDETIIRLLLENGAKVESKDNEGRTPLSYALLYRNKKVVELLESRKP